VALYFLILMNDVTHDFWYINGFDRSKKCLSTAWQGFPDGKQGVVRALFAGTHGCDHHV